MARTPEEIARELADRFAQHETDTPFFASTRPFFEKIVAEALAAAHASGREEGERAMRAEAVAEILSLPLHSAAEIARRVSALPVPSPSPERGE